MIFNLFIFFVGCCETVDDYIDLGFHSTSENINLLCKNTKARNKHESGPHVCFMNQPMKFGKKIYIRVSGIKECPRLPMDFGVTNKHAFDIDTIYSMKSSQSVSLPFSSNYDDVICLCLNKDSTCSYSINKGEEIKIQITCVSISSPVWLFFKMYDVTEIEISSEEIEGNWKKQMTYFMEY